MSTYIEIEIQKLLNETSDLDEVAMRLFQTVEGSPENLNPDNITGLSKFLLNSGRYQKLINFVIRHMDEGQFFIPWPYFMEAIVQLQIELKSSDINAFIEGIQETNAEAEASRSQKFSAYIPFLGEWENNRKYRFHKKYLNKKTSLIDQLFVLRTERLLEQEKKVLKQLQNLFPDDSDVKKEVFEHKQRSALDVLARYSPKTRETSFEDLSAKDPAVDASKKIVMQAMLEYAEQDADMAFELAIVAMVMEAPEEALEILSYSHQTAAAIWLRLELLLQARRFVELLSEVGQVELLFAQEPETFFATAYLRAQSLWGLGQKHSAIQVIEGLLASRPHYRAASALLSIWSGQR